MNDMHKKNPLFEKLLRSAKPLQDDEIANFIQRIDWQELGNFVEDSASGSNFCQNFYHWIAGNKNYFISGLNTLQPRVVEGITAAFHDFYFQNRTRTLKILPGEYPYHRDVFQGLGMDWGWLTLDGLCTRDFVILSYPFSGNGSTCLQFQEILERCEDCQIPLMLDCAFWGLTAPISLDLRSYPCIKKIAFSLSKIFNIGRYRIGVEFSAYTSGPNAILNQWDYVNKVGAFVGSQLIQAFPLDHIYQKYSTLQRNLCQELNLERSDTILFGIGGRGWERFARDKTYNRICLSDIICAVARREHDEFSSPKNIEIG